MAATDKHHKEIERLNMIGQRLHLLEKELVKQPHSFPAAMSACTTTICCSIPMFSIAAWAIATKGIYDMWYTHEVVSHRVSTLFTDNERVELLLDNMALFLRIGMAVITIVLLQAFAATGATREWLYGRHHGGVVTCLECLLGACTGHFALVFLILLFLAAFALMTVSVPAATGLAIVKSGCESSTKAQEGITSAIMAMRSHDDMERDLVRKHIGEICAQDAAEISDFAMIFAKGIVSAVLGQALLIVTHSNNLEKQMMQQDYDEVDKTEREIIVKFREARGEESVLISGQ